MTGIQDKEVKGLTVKNLIAIISIVAGAVFGYAIMMNRLMNVEATVSQINTKLSEKSSTDMQMRDRVTKLEFNVQLMQKKIENERSNN